MQLLIAVGILLLCSPNFVGADAGDDTGKRIDGANSVAEELVIWDGRGGFRIFIDTDGVVTILPKSEQKDNGRSSSDDTQISPFANPPMRPPMLLLPGLPPFMPRMK